MVTTLEQLGYTVTPPKKIQNELSLTTNVSGLGSDDPSVATSFRGSVWQYVEGEIDSPFEYFSLGLIFLNVIVFMTGTVYIGVDAYHIPCLPDTMECIRIEDKYDTAYMVFEIFSSIVFTIEYVLRVWSCVEDPQYVGCLGRLKYACTFYAIFDLAAFLPTWIELLPGVEDIASTGFLRVFRLVRLLKAEQYVDAFSILGTVLRDNSVLLIAASWYAFLALIFFSTVLYYTERDWSGETAKYYNSIPQALFPTTLMLTGEFPLSDFSPAGQFFAAILAVTAVAIFAVPTSVLGGGFIKALQEAKHTEFTVDA